MNEPISEFATPRKCSTCQKPASLWVFKQDKFGGKDKSSRQPRCDQHKETT